MRRIIASQARSGGHMTLDPEQVANWLKDAGEDDVKKIGAAQLLRAARKALHTSDDDDLDLRLEVDDVLRRYAAKHASQ